MILPKETVKPGRARKGHTRDPTAQIKTNGNARPFRYLLSERRACLPASDIISRGVPEKSKHAPSTAKETETQREREEDDLPPLICRPVLLGAAAVVGVPISSGRNAIRGLIPFRSGIRVRRWWRAEQNVKLEERVFGLFYRGHKRREGKLIAWSRSFLDVITWHHNTKFWDEGSGKV